MFTGIIEATGTVTGVEKGRDCWRLSVRLPAEWRLSLGESVSVDGACLTVVETKTGTAVFEIVGETRERTTLGEAKTGDRVNLERALKLGDRISGHLVAGHVDGTGRIRRRRDDGESGSLEIELPEELLRDLVPRGSVAVDGISLTVAALTEKTFSINVIPATRKLTTLGGKRDGDRVNVETDPIGKYVRKFLERKEPPPGKSAVTREFLGEHGFL